jgi:hypothetical protein
MLGAGDTAMVLACFGGPTPSSEVSAVFLERSEDTVVSELMSGEERVR